MEDILKKAGIKEFDNAVYSYYPQMLSWWDEDFPIAVEIEVEKDETGQKSIAVLFAVNEEDLKERDAVFLCEFKDGVLMQDTLVTDAVAEELEMESKLTYLEDEEAYATSSYDLSCEVLKNILGLIKSPQFVQRTSFCNIPDEYSEEPGETLNHFLAMFGVTYDEYSENNIREHIETAITIEGPEYLQDLKADLDSKESAEVLKEHGVDREVLQRIREEVESFQTT